MFDSQLQSSLAGHERRRHPRYPVVERMHLAVEDVSIGESIGIGEAVDISLGGLRVRHLPKHTEVREGDRLGLLLIDEEQALSLRAEVVHHGTADSFGVEFRDLSPIERREVDRLLRRIHA
ncbi:MAG TPA: PilZ domain-containing protein [Pyrinomonadaceae bacterium]|nr:PilZ domain-containing protein [Pyrinomonadaceae bacterium]